MTFKEASEALGYKELPDWLDEYSREVLIETVERLSEHGTKPISPQMANLCRAQMEEFG